MVSIEKSVAEVKDVIVSRRVVGGALVIVGAAVAIGATLEIFNKPLPFIKITPMQFAGALTLILGVSIVTANKVDILGIRKAVA